MKTARKTVMLILCAILLVVATVSGTLAYLTDNDTVTNTFTVGDVQIKLDEADVKEDGTYENGHNDRVTENTYHLLPGHTYYKDPTVTVLANSADSYVRVLVKVNALDNLKAALPKTKTVDGEEITIAANEKYYATDAEGNEIFLLQMLCNDENGDCTWNPDIWEYKGFDETTDTYEFRYHEIVVKDDANQVLTDVFTHITLPGQINNDDIKNLENLQIIVTAHAIQADGFTNADAAWEAFENQVNTNPNEEPEEEATETTVASDDQGKLFD